MSSAVGQTLTVLTSLLKSAGLFTSVDTVEPKSTPKTGVTAAIYLSSIKFAGTTSGLGVGTGIYEFTLRLYSNALQTPSDQVDPQLVIIIDKVFDALCGDFELGKTVRQIDILGQVSSGLSARAGHVDIGGTMYRAIDILIPLIINDTVTFTS